MARITVGKYIDRLKQCEVLESLATMDVPGWSTNARLVKKNARLSIFKFYVIQILYHVQMIIDVVEFASKW